MVSPLVRATQLLATAVTASEEEARTAAVLAAKLIAKHGFVLSAKPADAVVYPAAWEALFRLADPSHGSSAVFCHTVAWAPTDLTKIAIEEKRLGDAKLLRLLAFVRARGVVLPFGPSHPAWHRLKQLHAEQMLKQRQMPLPYVRIPTMRQVAEGLASQVSVKDVFDFFK